MQQFTIKRVNNTKFDKKVIQITLKFDIRNFLIKENKGQFGNKKILLYSIPFSENLSIFETLDNI